MKHSVYVHSHQGLGDHLICIGLYHSLATKYSYVYIPVRFRYLKDLKRISSLNKRFILYTYPDSLFEQSSLFHASLLSRMDCDILKLGYNGKNFLSENGEKFDESFFIQSGTDFNLRWDNFHYRRRIQREKLLFKLYGITPNDRYILVHEDFGRKYLINPDFFTKNKKAKTVKIRTIPGVSIFDYRLMIEQASELHLIESSFSIFADNIRLKNPNKFIHRYSRPEAINDPQHAANYRETWVIHESGNMR